MSSTPSFRDSLLQARRRLTDGRAEIREQHDSGSPGIQICTRLTDLLDAVVLDLYEAAIADLWPNGGQEIRDELALVAHGGYGRRDVAPYSDVDLMILFSPTAEGAVAPLASRLMHDLTDAGLDLGYALRSPKIACDMAAQDVSVCTSLMESRFLAGSEKLYRTFFDKFQRNTRRAYRGLFKSIDKARRKERSQYGETVYLLEPNIKRSRGGLRDLQLLRWLGFARFGVADIDELQLLGALTKDDQRTVRDAYEFLLRLRNDVHFHAGKSYDVLDKSEQVRLAKLYNYPGTPAILPVERFMQDYFRHTRAVRSVVSNFVANSRPGEAWNAVFGAIFSHQVDRDYRVSPKQIKATERGLKKLRTDLSETLRLCDLANLHDRRIAPATWETVRAAVPTFRGDAGPEVCKQFLSLLSQPGRLGELLRRLHELGVLEKIIPQFTHARCLLQFNEYHKYTVDEHCILAVERATDFNTDPGILGRVYKGIKNKRTLHLALLIHDLGKGFVEDHSELGLQIAEETAHRLRLPLREAEAIKFLVHKHLVMAHLAFWRDTSDEQLLVKFAVDVGSPEMLDLLFVLTAADIAAVGPDVLNSWKSEVLADLYQRAMERLAGDSPASDTAERLQQRKAAVRAKLVGEQDLEWYEQQINALPHAYTFSTPPPQIVVELKDLHTLKPGDVHATGRYLAESHTSEYTIGTYEQVTPGVFHKLTGALTSHRLQILNAEINTLANGLVMDRFYVIDPDYADEPPLERIDEVCQALVASLNSPRGSQPAFRKVWHSGSSRERVTINELPTRVQIDNSTSENFTIIDVFASDRQGLLFAITRTIFELQLSVSVAKIGTYLDQVVDVFYVTDEAGEKVQDEHRLQQIRERLLAAIEELVAV